MSIPPNQLFQILSPARENSTYRYRIRQAGLDFNAYLTYEIPQVSDERTILLVNVSYAFISDEHKFEYNRFIERIRESAGRFTGMKNIVNRLADKEFSKLPNVRVAVHKYGPVPVYVLPEKYSIANLGKILQVQIGVYPDIKSQFGSRKSINLKLPFLSTGSEFIRSLNLGLGLMFRRYLEDVGEGMFDIEYHLNLAGVFDRAKEIEAILAESVKSKLDVAFPSVSSFQYPSNEQDTLVNELFEKEKDWLLTARYARQYALYFLNELYGHIGMESRSQSYLDSFKDIQRQFDSLFELGYYQNARTRLSAVATLSKALRAYLDEDYEKIGEIDLASEPLWTRRFVQFGKFIASLNKEKIAATAGRIFISYHHDVPVTEVLKSQIQDYIKSQFGDRVHVLSVRESSAGIHFKSPIRSRIWLSDTIKGIVPKNTQTISGDNDKDYLWIAREVEYGLLLGKRIVYLVEKDIDDDRVLRDLRRARISLIPTDARVPEWLNQELVESFTECTRASFIVDNVGGTQEHLDPKVRPIIYEEAARAIERRHRDILTGFHQQFPESIRRTLRHIQELVPYPESATKKTLARSLQEKYPDVYPSEKASGKAITNAWGLAKKRTLLINGESMPLMRLNKGLYSGNLRFILKQLRPDWDDTTVENWEQRILKTSPSESETPLV